jgi:lysophospholipase L1-like esterase
VITAAVPHYSSGNELGLLAQRLLSYPIGALVLLDGYEDLRLPSSARAVEIYPRDKDIGATLRSWGHSLYLLRAIKKLLGHSPAPALPLSAYQTFHEDHLAFEPQELQARISRLRENWQKIAQAVVNVPTLIAVQPVVFGKQNFSVPERQMIDKLGQTYRQRLATSLQSLELIKPQEVSQRANLRWVNLTNFYRLSPNPDFIDPIHLTKSANQQLAEHLAQQLLPLLTPEIGKSE